MYYDEEVQYELTKKLFFRALKELCEETLSGSISVSNAVDLFQLAELHGAKKLRADALDYMARKFEEVGF